jgi:hypothetical protein
MTSKIVVYQFRKKHPCPWLSGFIQAAAKDFDLIIEEFDETKPYSPDTVFTLEPKDYRKKVYPQWFHDYKIIVNLNGESFADPWIDLYSEDKNILFVTFEPDTDNLCVYKVDKEEEIITTSKRKKKTDD